MDIYGCFDYWYIMHDSIWEYPHLCVFLCVNTPFHAWVLIWPYMHASYELNFILLWGLRKIVCLVDCSMALSFDLNYLLFQTNNFMIFLILIYIDKSYKYQFNGINSNPHEFPFMIIRELGMWINLWKSIWALVRPTYLYFQKSLTCYLIFYSWNILLNMEFLEYSKIFMRLK